MNITLDDPVQRAYAIGAAATLVLAVAVAIAAALITRARRAQPTDPTRLPAGVRLAGGLGILTLAAVGITGQVLSYSRQVEVVRPWLGVMAWAFPALVDTLVIGCTLRYVHGVRAGRVVPAYRWTAFAGVAGSILMNTITSGSWTEFVVHLVVPASAGAVVELVSIDAMKHHQVVNDVDAARIPAILWVTDFRRSLAVLLLMARSAITDHTVARARVGQIEAALEALRMHVRDADANPVTRALHLDGARTRSKIRAYLLRCEVAPEIVLDACGLLTADADGEARVTRTPRQILSAVTRAMATRPEAAPTMAAQQSARAATRARPVPRAPRVALPAPAPTATGAAAAPEPTPRASEDDAPATPEAPSAAYETARALCGGKPPAPWKVAAVVLMERQRAELDAMGSAERVDAKRVFDDLQEAQSRGEVDLGALNPATVRSFRNAWEAMADVADDDVPPVLVGVAAADADDTAA